MYMRIGSLKGWILTILSLGIIMPTIALCFFLYNLYSTNIETTYFSTMKRVNEQANENIAAYIRDAESLTNISTNEEVVSFFESVPLKDKENNNIFFFL